MLSASRKVAFVLFAVLTLAATGCGGNAKKIVGKWKVTQIGEKEKDEMKGADLFIEFKADGTGAVSMEATDPKAKEIVEMVNKSLPTFKWTINGDKIELTNPSKDSKEGLFGKKEKGTATIKFEGDNLTITPDPDPDDKKASEKTIKLTKVK